MVYILNRFPRFWYPPNFSLDDRPLEYTYLECCISFRLQIKRKKLKKSIFKLPTNFHVYLLVLFKLISVDKILFYSLILSENILIQHLYKNKKKHQNLKKNDFH